MGRASVRSAVATFITGAVSGVGTVYPSPPKIAQTVDFDPATLGGSGAIVIVHLPSDKRTRVSLGGYHADKIDRHQVALEVQFASFKTDATQAQSDHDAIIDGLIGVIEANHNLGVPAVVFEAGEGDFGIEVEQGEPWLSEDGQTVRIDALIRFEVLEWVNA